MKAIIFAGGSGTRLWPLSRKHSPKQFEKVIGDKSTLELTIEKLAPDIGWENIYIGTAERYITLVKKHIPNISIDNIIGEPEPRDVGPAVGLVTAKLLDKFGDEPIVILWSDHLVKQYELFRNILAVCNTIISGNPKKIIFIGQKPRFASQNLGWIEYGDSLYTKKNIKVYNFLAFHYRPSIETAKNYFQDGHHVWNVGYFVTTPSFIWKQFQKYQPEMSGILENIRKSVKTKNYNKVLRNLYPKLHKISFDNAILEKINKSDAMVISEDLGWSDIGAWEALKEALQVNPEQNVSKGKVLVEDCRDSLVYNYTDQLVVTIDLDGLVVVNTKDAVLVCHKNSVPKIKKLVENLAQSENNHLV